MSEPPREITLAVFLGCGATAFIIHFPRDKHVAILHAHMLTSVISCQDTRDAFSDASRRILEGYNVTALRSTYPRLSRQGKFKLFFYHDGSSPGTYLLR